MAARVALMSIRPRFAELVLAGIKTVELRRRPVGLTAGDKVYVYVSGPVMAIRGSFVVASVEQMPLVYLWKAVRDRAHVSRKEFDAYFDGLDEGVAIGIASVCEEPLMPLSELRERWPGFHPPQTLRYLSEPPAPQARGAGTPRRRWRQPPCADIES